MRVKCAWEFHYEVIFYLLLEETAAKGDPPSCPAFLLYLTSWGVFLQDDDDDDCFCWVNRGHGLTSSSHCGLSLSSSCPGINGKKKGVTDRNSRNPIASLHSLQNISVISPGRSFLSTKTTVVKNQSSFFCIQEDQTWHLHLHPEWL